MPATDHRHARWATAFMFFVSGAVFGSLAARLPELKDQAALSDGQFGLALLGFPLGTVIALPLVSRLISHHGSGPVLKVSVGLYVLAALLPALPTTLAGLLTALTVFGLTTGLLDTAMNAHAISVERRFGRSVISGLHAAYSLGGLTGAVVGAAAVRVGLEPLAHFTLWAGLLGFIAVPLSRWLLPGSEDAHEPSDDGERPVAPWTLLTVLVGLVAFSSFVGEGAAGDWSAVHMAQVLAAPPAVAALAFAGYSGAMTVGRLFGDRLIDRFGPVRLLRAGGAMAAAGIVLVVTSDLPALTIGGWTIVGFGLSSAAPLAFKAAGNLPGVALGPAMARVTAIGYAGVMIGPPIIGAAAEVTNLSIALLIPGATALALIPLASVLKRIRPSASA